MAGTLAQPRLGPRLGNADGARLGCRWSTSPQLTLKAWTLELELLGSNLGRESSVLQCLLLYDVDKGRACLIGCCED